MNPSAAQQFALIVHELATNAIKHGSLSVADGRVAIEGRIEGTNGSEMFRFAWRGVIPDPQGFRQHHPAGDGARRRP